MLIFISLYFFIFSNKIHINTNAKNGIIAGSIAGVGNGLFSIGGPAAILYMLPSVKTKETYIGCIQFYFLINNLISISIRLHKGVVTSDHLPLILTGWIGIILGTFTGFITFKRIPMELLKKIVYLFVGLSGIWLIVDQIL